MAYDILVDQIHEKYIKTTEKQQQQRCRQKKKKNNFHHQHQQTKICILFLKIIINARKYKHMQQWKIIKYKKKELP